MSKIVTAIAKIMGDVGSVKKDGKNKFHDYNYATASDVQHKLQPLLSREGLVIFQNELERAMIADGSALAVTYEFVLVHTGGEVWPDRLRYTGMAAARNSKGGFDDKAGNKCHTAARKYFMLALFQIPTGDYDDADEQEDRPDVPKTFLGSKPRYDHLGKRIDWIDTTAHRVPPLNVDDARPVAEVWLAAMRKNTTAEGLVSWGEHNAKTLASFPEKWQALYQNEYQELLDALRAKQKEAA